MAVHIDEIAPDLFRFSLYIPQANLQFNQFLLRDDEPLLYHTGLRQMFPMVKDAVTRILDPSRIRWIGFSHYEADECGSLNEWLAVAPRAEPVCGAVGAVVNINDVADRKARVLEKDDVLKTGKYRFRLVATPHVPHGWDAGHLFEESEATLLCSDLFLQSGDVEPLTGESLIDRSREALREYQAGPLAHATVWSPLLGPALEELAALEPRHLAVMHGSSFSGDGAGALRELRETYRAVLDEKESPPR
ncbi:MBL fold metallo-hydrolase [Desulfuromonas sp. TF]|uniref:MBL fold metallo-hydrolase n=1 Tax=Desulfuromonas sp. TF TaxID=1232410 RepID=UPI00041E2C34|nr:MBL fold metallo-hydrolase [Desulfuromonas sp. TF]